MRCVFSLEVHDTEFDRSCDGHNMQAACVGLPHRTEDNRLLGLALDKRVQGEHWRRLFRGDPDGARCMLPPYRSTGVAGSLQLRMLVHSYPVEAWAKQVA